jgi:hypothetical protein
MNKDNPVTQEMEKAMQSVPPEVIRAGVDVYLWWKSNDFSRWYEMYPYLESDLEVVVRAMWSTMQAVRR